MTIPLGYGKDNMLATKLQSWMIGSIECLRYLGRLAIIDACLSEKDHAPEVVRENTRKTWKRGLVNILKDSPWTDRKLYIPVSCITYSEISHKKYTR